jgi:excisionase family DNA binding protein
MSSPKYPTTPNNDDTLTSCTTADPPRELHQLHTLEAVALRLAISKRTLQRMIDRRLIKAVRLLKSVRVSEAELQRIVSEGVSDSYSTPTKKHSAKTRAR